MVVDCRCPEAAPHWPWVAGAADAKMVGRFAGCCASVVSGHAARDAGEIVALQDFGRAYALRVMNDVFAGSEMSPLIPSRPDIRKCSRQDRVVPQH